MNLKKLSTHKVSRMKNLMKKSIVQSILLIIAGLITGWLFFHHSEVNTENKDGVSNISSVWTCAMHPQIRRDKPGKCPICGMELIPLRQENIAESIPGAIQLDEATIKLADIQTSKVSFQKSNRETRLYGTIQVDERQIRTISSSISGRIDRIFVNYTGAVINKGQTIALIYSPELVTAQRELLEAKKYENSNQFLLDAAREKLRQWKLTDAEIAEIEKRGEIIPEYELKADKSGTVLNKNVNTGDYISQGQTLFELANLSSVWVILDAYETDLPWIKIGNKIHFTSQATPGDEFSGIIDFIDPLINPQTRVARIRVEANNLHGELRPGMFVTAIVESGLKGYATQLIIPNSAILWTGKHSIVYLRIPGSGLNLFKVREITLGPAVANGYIVANGLNEGDEIVTNGAFSVDAAAQLAGKPSMMNPASTAGKPQGGVTNAMPGMNMPEENNKESKVQTKENNQKSESDDMEGMPGMK
jgi:membrane fusion protein, copper/silver efflux system